LPVFKKLNDREIQELTRRRSNLQDLQPYLDHLQTLRSGDWGSIQLDGEDSQRTVKRRTSMAASAQGKKVVWRRSPDAKTLVFRVDRP
jgi:hypothetical protein